MIRFLPNILTVIRLLMALLFVPVFFYEQQGTSDTTISLTLYTLASLTDIIDGYIARKYSVISNFGKILDPIADKLLQIIVSVCITFVEPVFVLIPVFLLVKEFFMLIGTILLYRKNVVMGSNIYGKMASFIYFLLFFIMIGFRTFLPFSVKLCFIVIFLFASLLAFIQYFKAYLQIKQKF